MKRCLDIILSFCALLVCLFPMGLIAIVIKMTSPGPIFYWSDRVGTMNVIFRMPKYRSMQIDTPAVATHLLSDPNTYLTCVGKFLRKTSFDELPQLISIIKGDMSFVGPRPALFNQDDLVALRTEKGVHTLTPGLTGWAQINGRDELPINIKVDYDEYYLHNKSFFLDMKIIWKTFLKVAYSEGVQH
jgi:O-antigen biosynthesis protein WbqP